MKIYLMEAVYQAEDLGAFNNVKEQSLLPASCKNRNGWNTVFYAHKLQTQSNQ